MAWQIWIVIAYFTYGALATVAHVGKPRGPITPRLAVATVIAIGVIIALLVWGSL